MCRPLCLCVKLCAVLQFPVFVWDSFDKFCNTFWLTALNCSRAQELYSSLCLCVTASGCSATHCVSVWQFWAVLGLLEFVFNSFELFCHSIVFVCDSSELFCNSLCLRVTAFGCSASPLFVTDLSCSATPWVSFFPVRASTFSPFLVQLQFWFDRFELFCDCLSSCVTTLSCSATPLCLCVTAFSLRAAHVCV